MTCFLQPHGSIEDVYGGADCCYHILLSRSTGRDLAIMEGIKTRIIQEIPAIIDLLGVHCTSKCASLCLFVPF